MKQYNRPRTEVISVQTHTQLLAGSSMSVKGGEQQSKAW